MNIVTFEKHHIEEAKAIAFANYEEERSIVGALPEIERTPGLDWFAENGLGVAALKDGELVGFLCCVQNDDMPVADILWADLIVLATPIYAWYCAAPMKNVLDRHYGFNKYYGSTESSLWTGKKWPSLPRMVTMALTPPILSQWAFSACASTRSLLTLACTLFRMRTILHPSKPQKPLQAQRHLQKNCWNHRYETITERKI